MQRMARFYVHVLVLFLGLLVLGNGINPGFKARVTTKGLKYANDVAIAALAKSVKRITIPDIHGSDSGFDYSIYHIHVTDFNPPESSISLVPGHGLSWTASNAGISIIGDFNYKISWIFEDDGSFDAKVQGVSFGIEIDLGVDANGRPSITARNCGSSIANVDFHFHGGMAWLYNLFRGNVGDEIKNQLNGKMCELIVNQINEDGEKQLAKLEVTTTLATNFLLDYRLIQTPSFNSQFMETAHKGEIYWASEPTRECPFFPPFMPDNGDTSSMLYLFVSDYLFDSMAYNAQTHGFLKYNLTQKDLPPSSRGVLNTTCDSLMCVGKLIPQIGVKYPNMNVELRMNSTMAPRMNITSQGVNLTFQGMIDLYARKDGVSDTPFLISLLANMSTSVNVLIQNELLYAEINALTLKLKVIKSAVGTVPDQFLDFLINQALKAYIIPQLNELGKKGFPLPLTGDITFQNTKLAFAQDTIIISTDLKYTPNKVKDFGGPLKFQPHVNVIPI